MRVISGIRKQLQIEVGVKELFTHPTIAGLSEYLSNKQEVDLLPAIEAKPRPDQIPLSFSQERLWFIDRLEGSTHYHIPAVLRLTGDLSVSALENAIKTIVQRHEVLRSVIYEENGIGYQKVNDFKNWKLEIIDNSSLINSEKELKLVINELVKRPFNLSKDYMLRAHLIKLNPKENILIVTLHHIASDGWSTSVLVKEVVALYNAIDKGISPELNALPIQYADYAIWQNSVIKGHLVENKIEYWKTKLNGVTDLDLPTDKNRPAVFTKEGATKSFRLEKHMIDALEALSKEEGTTMFMTLLAAFNVLLHKYTSQEDICIGTSIAGRQQNETEELIGYFLNTLPLRTTISNNRLFKELLKQVRATTLEAYENQEAPFEMVVDEVVKDRERSRSPLFQVFFEYQNTPELPELALGDVVLTPIVTDSDKVKFDLALNLRDTKEGIFGVFQYYKDIFEESTIERLASHFHNLLEEIVRYPDKLISELDILSASESKMVLFDFNNTKKEFPEDETVVSLFEKRVKLCPNAIALVYNDTELTFLELDQKSNQFANYLRAKGVSGNTFLPLIIDRKPEMVIAILGILKSGAAYVPIDPDFPTARKEYVLKDISAKNIISHSEIKLGLNSDDYQVINIDTDWEIIDREEKTFKYITKCDDIAYLIYTSGSTGHPKGVMIEHRNLVHYLCNSDTKYIDENSHNSGSFIHLSYTFDASITALFMPLIFGKLVVIGAKNSIEVFQDKNFIKYAPYDFIKLTPVHLELIQTSFNTTNSIIPTGKLVVGGEALNPGHFKYFRDHDICVEVINEYGPTEATVGCTVFSFNSNDTSFDVSGISIGKPIANTEIYILNNMQPAPIGVIGEIFISGAGIARGYLGLEDQNKAKFINHPFIKNQGLKLYRTGDLAKWTIDGKIEYVGRVDEQVKVRGFRIELSEIESHLMKSDLIDQVSALVSNVNIDQQRLLAFYVPNWENIRTNERKLYNSRISEWNEYFESDLTKDTDIYHGVHPKMHAKTLKNKKVKSTYINEWFDPVKGIIFTYKPKNVLSINCGLGYTYELLKDNIESFTGTDSSSKAIQILNEKYTDKNTKPGSVKFIAEQPLNLSFDEDQKFDTILINAVSQYFPGLDYLKDVIEKALSFLTEDGNIIICDIHNYNLQFLEKAGKEALKLPSNTEISDFIMATEQTLLTVKELAISPEYFYNLKKVFPALHQVNVKCHGLSTENNLAAFRYNAILSKRKSNDSIKPEWLDWAQNDNRQEIIKWLEEGRDNIGLLNVPNPLLYKEIALVETLNSSTINNLAELAKKIESSKPDEGLDKILNFVSGNGYVLSTFPGAEPTQINLHFQRSKSEKFIEVPPESAFDLQKVHLSNIPLFEEISGHLENELKKYCQNFLPNYMVPVGFIPLASMPVTNNGKIDRKLLLKLVTNFKAVKLKYQAPETHHEKVLAKIWSDLLGVKKISRYDNFFELGGHSLMALRVNSAILKEFNLEITINTQFEFTTLYELANYIEIKLQINTQEDSTSEFDLLYI